MLCERVRELGLEDSRYFDLVRYKRADRFEKRLHGLLAYRLDDTGNRITGNAKWNEGDKNKGALQPTRFEYERFELSKRSVVGGHTDLIPNGIFLHSRKRKLTKDMDDSESGLVM